MSSYEHPVFGPMRPSAAMSAIAELANATAAFKEHCHGWADYDSPTVRDRYNKAREVRAMYAEYGESYDAQYTTSNEGM